jgi:ABC-type transport system involved in Fe-S cluster assembly fused permease/ATPase subunit
LLTVTGRGAWIAVAVYAALTFANSGACIGWLQFWLWQPVEDYSYNALNTAAYSHVMNLSCDFHEAKEPSEIHQAVLQGRSITGLVDTICFQLIPMFIDLILVFAFLYYLFGPYMALNLAITTLFYLYTTTKLVKITQARRRDYILFWRKEWRSAHNSLDNWRVASVSLSYICTEFFADLDVVFQQCSLRIHSLRDK